MREITQKMPSWSIRHSIVIGMLTTLAFAPCLVAQVITGSILGKVKDQTGAVIPGASISLTNEGTNSKLSVKTDSAGSYTFPVVNVGTYTVTASNNGFKTVQHLHIAVRVQQNVVVDFTLPPGSVTQNITVTAAVPLLQTQSASTGQVIGHRSINNLPLNGRNFTFLARTVTGVTVSQQDNRGLAANGTFSANGTRPYENNYLLDGMDNNSDLVDYLNGTYFVAEPPIDALQEFKIQTSNYSAQFGRGGGAVLNAVVKSGTNQVHGDVWEFFRNDALDAADFFANAGGQHIAEYRQNQFGFTLGGPVVIPHVYNGHDKTFFFMDYQGLRIREGMPEVATVPTTLERSSGYTDFTRLISGQSGTLTDLLGRKYALGTIFDPATTRAVTQQHVDASTGLTAVGNGFVRDPFPKNIVPVSRLNPVAIGLLNLYPLPTSSSLFNNYTVSPVLRNNENQFDVKLDEAISQKDSIFGRVSYSNNPQLIPGPFPGVADGGSFSNGDQEAITWNGIVSETHIFSSSVVNDAKIGYSRIDATRFQPLANQMGIPQEYGIGGIPQVPLNGGLPTFTIGGLSTLGSNGYLPSVEINPTLQFLDSLSMVRGAHTLSMGYEFQNVRYTLLQPPTSRGTFNFSGTYTGVPNQNSGNTGIVQFLLAPAAASVPGGFDNVGGANSVSATNINDVDATRSYDAGYLQDDWRLASRLTLNLGLRYEYFGAPIERYNAQANFVPGAPFAGAAFRLPSERLNVPLSPAFTNALNQDGIALISDKNRALTDWPTVNLAPRVGLAYRATKRLVVRAGYGLFYDGFENRFGGRSLGNNYPFLVSYSFPAPTAAQPITSDNTIGGLAAGLSNVSFSPESLTVKQVSGITFNGYQANAETPYTQDVNLTLEYQLSGNQSVTAAYVGTFSRHLFITIPSNAVDALAPPQVNPQTLVPYPGFARGGSYSATEGNSYYHALQLTFQRRLSHGLDFLVNYAYSKARSDARDLQNNDVGGYRAPWVPGFGIQGDYSLADFDVRNIFHVSGGYRLPFGKGEAFLSHSHGLVNTLVGGWQTYWILTLQTGQPFTIPCSISTTAGLGCNALLVPGERPYFGPHDVDHWLNPAAFANPPVASAAGQSGLAPLGGPGTQVEGPPFRHLDFSLFKEFQISERFRLEFRTEVFNLTNTPNFSFPGFSGNGVTAAPGAKNFTNTANFGKITSTRDNPHDPRQIQFALKLYW